MASLAVPTVRSGTEIDVETAELQDTLTHWLLDEARTRLAEANACAESLKGKVVGVGQLAIGLLGLFIALAEVRPESNPIPGWALALGYAPLALAGLVGTRGLLPHKVYGIGRTEEWMQTLRDSDPRGTRIVLFEQIVDERDGCVQRNVVFQRSLAWAYWLTIAGVALVGLLLICV